MAALFHIRTIRFWGQSHRKVLEQNKKKAASYPETALILLAGETRFERATGGFGDRCSTVEPLPFVCNEQFNGWFALCQV